jgi:hypothetical protein
VTGCAFGRPNLKVLVSHVASRELAFVGGIQILRRRAATERGGAAAGLCGARIRILGVVVALLPGGPRREVGGRQPGPVVGGCWRRRRRRLERLGAGSGREEEGGHAASGGASRALIGPFANDPL